MRVLISLLETLEFCLVMYHQNDIRRRQRKTCLITRYYLQVLSQDIILGQTFPELNIRLIWGSSQEEGDFRGDKGTCDLST